MTPVVLDGIPYYTIQQFAKLTHRTKQSVSFLLKHGNSYRKLKAYHVEPLNIWMIPVSELTDYPFTLAGKGSYTFHYNEVGEVIE